MASIERASLEVPYIVILLGVGGGGVVTTLTYMDI